MQNIHTILKETFGFETFREWQEKIVESVIAGNNTLVFMPTGWGKSLTYQIPWIAKKWVAIIISPLISLMKDQVDSLRKLWIRAELVNSSINYSEQQDILNDLSKNDDNIKFLYIAPERLNSNNFIRVLKNIDISLIAIDEAHCISQWWHDFRPSYMKIKGFVKTLQEAKDCPVIALTATATQKVKTDIVKRLGLETYEMFTAGFDRENLILIVREIGKKDEKNEKTLEILSKTPWSGIIYCSSRKAVDEVYQYLSANNIKVWKYTGAMTPASREQMQNNFMNDTYKVIVATNAFGMWIDKKDIRFVIHYNLPGSIENYYQEVWRAWRDGKNSFWVVLASYQDTKIQEFFIENSHPTKKEILKLYDYLHRVADNNIILRTYYDIASNSGIKNDMKVWTIIKILEKYWILKRGVDDMWDAQFRGRWITLTQEKRSHSHLLIDWKLQSQLETEAYYKLDQIKRMLFHPHCRRKFILEYFWDDDDLKNLSDNCGTCDFCIDIKKYQTWELVDIVPMSVFAIVLDMLQELGEKFGVWMIVKILTWSTEKRILDQDLDENDFYWSLSDYSPWLVKVVIEALIENDFLYKTDGQYPLLVITELWQKAIYKDSLIKSENQNLQQYIHMKYVPETKKKGLRGKKIWTSKWSTYIETLDAFKEWKSLKQISEMRDIKLQTIESHIIKLYLDSKISLLDMMKLIDYDNVVIIKNIIETYFTSGDESLTDIKLKCESEWTSVKWFEIHACKAMMQKKDI